MPHLGGGLWQCISSPRVNMGVEQLFVCFLVPFCLGLGK